MKIVRPTIVFILFFAFALNMFSFWAIKAYYIVNQEKIETLYCINKDKPKLACHGKCHLNKILSSIDDLKKVDKTKIPIIYSVYFIGSQFLFEHPKAITECVHTFHYLEPVYLVNFSDLEKIPLV